MQGMLAQIRESPAEEVLIEVVNALLRAVQIKLGRPDARLLLDAVAAMAEAVSDRVEPALSEQVLQAVTQFRLAQVEAEGGAGGAPAEGGRPEAAAPAASARAEPSSPAPTAPTVPGRPAPTAGRLWVPGR